jgi:hypothetical protein
MECWDSIVWQCDAEINGGTVVALFRENLLASMHALPPKDSAKNHPLLVSSLKNYSLGFLCKPCVQRKANWWHDNATSSARDVPWPSDLMVSSLSFSLKLRAVDYMYSRRFVQKTIIVVCAISILPSVRPIIFLLYILYLNLKIQILLGWRKRYTY